MSKEKKCSSITSGATEKEQSNIINKSIAEKQQKAIYKPQENLKNLEQGVLERLQWKNCMIRFIRQK